VTAVRPRTAADGWLLVWSAATAILLLLPSSLVPGLASTGVWGLDKAGHVLVFLVLAALAVAPARARVRRPIVAAAAVSFAYGAVLELVQGALGWRSAEIADLLANGVGSLLGASSSLLWGRP
jgi:VanZ family protein